MKFELHPNAAAAFNEQGNLLADSVGLVSRPLDPPDGNTFRPEFHVSGKLSAHDVRGPVETSEVDQYGTKISRFVIEGATTIGLNETAYGKLRKLAQAIQKTDSFACTTSTKFIEDALFRWSLEKVKGKTAKTACEYVAAEADANVSKQEIWVPVCGLNIQSTFSIGRVSFKTITRWMIDDWHARIKSKVPDNPQINFKFDRERKDLLGFAAATVEIEAEPVKAKELANDLSDKAISLLRLFSVANFDPNQISYCVPLGSHQRYGHHYISVRNGQILSDDRGITRKGQFPWVINDLLLKEFNSTGLEVISRLFEREPKTEFEQSIFDALLLYSNAALVPTLAEKLLYMFAAFESVLLRDANEPVTEAIAERLAYVAADASDSRLAVRKLVKQAYGVRSRFVHHGKREDTDLTEFFLNAWTGLMRLAERALQYKTKAELLDSMDRYKYR
jgi:hypothetical protein